MKHSKQWTTVTPLSKLLALILFIALPFIGFYLGYNYKKPDQPITSTSNSIIWQTYQSPLQLLTIKYPSNWKISFADAGNLEKNPQSLKDINLDGPEGKIRLHWLDSFGGGCDQKNWEKIDIGNKQFNACHSLNNPNTNAESWTNIENKFNPKDNLGLAIEAYANKSANKEIILSILHNLKLSSSK